MVLKIFIGLTEIAGYYGNLKKGFRDNGIECTFVNLSHHTFEYNGDDIENVFVQIYKRIIKRQIRGPNWIRYPLFPVQTFLKFLIFLWAISKYNVFIFGFGESFFHHYDLPILKFFNKKIIFVFSGSDSRPPYLSDFLGYGNCNSITDKIKITAARKKKILIIEMYADFVIDTQSSSHFHEMPIISFLKIGVPVNSPILNHQKIEEATNSYVTILHAPSNLKVKGTELIRSYISALKGKGHPIHYVEINGMSHDRVLEELEKCDFIVDQLYSDGPMATFATEAAWFGKGAVIGGYYAQEIFGDYPSDILPPSLYCHPDQMLNSIEKMIVDKEFRRNLGEKAKQFVNTRWKPEQVAKRYEQIIEGKTEVNFFYNPREIKYTLGCCASESCIKDTVREMIEFGGIETLCISDKPNLEKKFLNMIFEKTIR